MKQIIVCDDDREIVEALTIYLKQDNFKVFPCYNGKEAMSVLRKNHIDLIIMDIMMPGENGIQVVKKIRDESNVPVIFLSAKSEEYDTIQGLDAGGDDYVTKPFKINELRARIRSVLKRSSITEKATQKKEYSLDGIVINPDTKKVTVNKKAVKLTNIEYNILLYFMRNVDKVLSSNDIYKEVWNESEAYNIENTVAVHIRHLRGKIEKNPKKPRYLKVVWGIGYRLEN